MGVSPPKKKRKGGSGGNIFEIEMLPAREGDCLLLTWGTRRKLHHALIDGGRSKTYPSLKHRLEELPAKERTLELFVISHIDRDHIEGALAFLEDRKRPVRFRDIWFNSYDHLRGAKVEAFGALQGERLSAALLRQRLPWNKAFRGKPAETQGARPVAKKLAGGLKITLLSPDRKRLEALIPAWKCTCEDAGLIPGVKARRREIAKGLEVFGRIDIKRLAKLPFEKDDSAPNGTSIAFLAEFKNKRILLAADAHPNVLEESLVATRRARPGRKISLTALKVSHHGSVHNTSPELLNLIKCPKFLISTNGSIHQHPDATAIARLIRLGKPGKELIFNYHSDETLVWTNSTWQGKPKYSTRYPMKGEEGLVIVKL